MTSTDLQGKNVLIFAATGAIAGRVARAAADRGATVWASGRDKDALAELTRPGTGGGRIETAVVDAGDTAQVEDYVADVARTAGTVDAVFNGIGGRPRDLGYPERLEELGVEQFMLPLQVILASQYLTSRTAGLRMAEQGAGAVVTLSATLTGMAAAHMAGITAACGAVEAMTRSLAGELGPRGVRVNCVRATAMPETRTIQETGAGQARITGGPPSFDLPPLGRPVTVDETVSTALFLASDAASGMTGQVVTVCAGQFVG